MGAKQNLLHTLGGQYFSYFLHSHVVAFFVLLKLLFCVCSLLLASLINLNYLLFTIAFYQAFTCMVTIVVAAVVVAVIITIIIIITIHQGIALIFKFSRCCHHYTSHTHATTVGTVTRTLQTLIGP